MYYKQAKKKKKKKLNCMQMLRKSQLHGKSSLDLDTAFAAHNKKAAASEYEVICGVN